MKIETIRKNHKKSIIISVIAFIVIAVVLIVGQSFAKYSLVKNIKIAEGTINYKVPDFKIMAMYKNDGNGDTEIDSMPESGYTINESKTYCEVNGTKDTNARIYTDDSGQHIISNITKGSRCYLYFDKINYLVTVPGDEGNLPSSKDSFLGGNITREQIESIKILDKIEIPEGATSFDVSESQNKSIMAWYQDTNNNGLYEVYIGGKRGVKANPNSQFLFSSLSELTSIDLKNLDTYHVESMYGMFYNLSNLTTLDLSSFNTSKVINMGGMFSAAVSITSLDLSSFDTSNVEYMGSMFLGTDSLTSLNLSSFNTSNVTDMAFMFYRTSKLTSLDLSSFNTSKVNNMEAMFTFAQSLTNLNVSSFDTSKVEYMGSMFAYVTT